MPHKRWHSVTLLASITTQGMGAAMVLDGALARESFDAYIEQLRLLIIVPGQIVVLDNLPVHKSARARALIEGAGCRVLFLPADSPVFNPIELAFANIKQALRGKVERTIIGIVAPPAPPSRPSPPLMPAASSSIVATTCTVNSCERRSSRLRSPYRRFVPGRKPGRP